MRPPPISSDAIHHLLKRISDSRFATLSVCLHAVFILLVGGTVLYRAAPAPPDFQAGADGLLVENTEKTAPTSEPAFTAPSDQQIAPTPPMAQIPLSVLLTSSKKVSNWKMTELPKSSLSGISDSMKNGLASLSDRLAGAKASGAGAASGVMGSTGGTRSAMIFGKRIMASRLGVILDVSGSAHSRLSGAVTEIQNGFADAPLILYPGCGMVQFDGKTEYVIRKFSSITPQELKADTGSFTTRAQIERALTVDTFQKMTLRPSVKDTLFVAWYKENSNDKMIGQTQVAFDDLIKRGVDAIYWFSDFEDPVDPRVTIRLAAQLKSRRIVLHLHNFSGRATNPVVAELATGTGGTVDEEKN